MDGLTTRDRAEALGYLWYPFTPTLGAPDQTWIPGWVEDQAGQAVYLTSPLTRESMTFPSGRTLEDWEAKTAPRIASWSPAERPMRMGMSLEPLLEGGYFARVWDPGRHIIDSVPSGLDLWLVGSIDHSFRSGRAAVGLTGYAVSGPIGARRLVAYDLIDIQGDGADYDQLAASFLAAMSEAGIPLEAVDQWVGDRASVSILTHRRRDNYAWRGAILSALRRAAGVSGAAPSTVRAPQSLWRIATPRKGAGSSEYLMSELRRAMAETPPRLYILRRCRALAAAIPRWDGTRSAAEKDPLDRIGYSWEAAHRHHGLWRDGVT